MGIHVLKKLIKLLKFKYISSIIVLRFKVQVILFLAKLINEALKEAKGIGELCEKIPLDNSLKLFVFENFKNEKEKKVAMKKSLDLLVDGYSFVEKSLKLVGAFKDPNVRGENYFCLLNQNLMALREEL